MIKNPKVISELMNEYFIQVANEINGNNNSTTNIDVNKNPNGATLEFFKPTNDKILRKIFSRFKPNMSTGIDGLNKKIYKVCESELNKPLIHLIKVSIWSEVFPDKCKVTKVRPAFKKGGGGMGDGQL